MITLIGKNKNNHGHKVRITGEPIFQNEKGWAVASIEIEILKDGVLLNKHAKVKMYPTAMQYAYAGQLQTNTPNEIQFGGQIHWFGNDLFEEEK